MIRIFQNKYTDPNPNRDAELRQCLEINEENANVVSFTDRLTYKQIFELVNTIVSDEDVSIVCNSDIYFLPQDLKLIEDNLKKNEVYALARWDFDTLFDRPDAQDTWCFRGKIRIPEFSDFTMGIRGCDNRIAHELKEVGYEVKNPAKTIRSYHLHTSNVRRYMTGPIVPPPYLTIHPHTL
jgi:hypothetical protein